MDKRDISRNEYLFHQGTLFDAYRFLGCTLTDKGAVFRTAAPNAASVSVIGDFNDWNCESHRMVRKTDKGLYELSIDGIKCGDRYKFCITAAGGRRIIKCDPYALRAEDGGGRASMVYDLSKIRLSDDKYMSHRETKDIYNSPINIYEAHIGSWRKHIDGRYYTYREFADSIVPYLVDMSYTHLELMGIAEYPFDGSWGYQVTGYFAPTARYGTPEDLAYLVDKCHKNNIAVILDWVPGHFPKDDFGLYEYDGTPYFEPGGNTKREHKEWGTCCFDYGREEVQSFLVSNALYWMDVFHIDGLRVDAVASMLYLDYGRKAGEWAPNTKGGNENLDAIAFLRKLNSAVFERHKGVMMIAEESTAFPLVTAPVHEGGLGFNFKWNMGWMNDNLSYAKTDPFFRVHNHNKLTFSMMYAFSENYILPISHDEVVHGKGSLIGKMPGDTNLKFAAHRNFLMAMYSHPGKKLLFMGAEFGQFAEWNYAKELEWFLIDTYPNHKSCLDFVSKLNGLYKNNAPFWAIDYGWEGFEWLVADDNRNSVLAYQRKAAGKSGTSGKDKGERIVCIYNFSPLEYKGYTLGVDKGEYAAILQSGLHGWNTDTAVYKTTNTPSHGKAASLTIDIAPMSGIWLRGK